MPAPSDQASEIRRLAAARDEALRRYTQHLTAIELRSSRWSAVLSPGRPPARVRQPLTTGKPGPATHAR
jgi:hypothetical protein